MRIHVLVAAAVLGAAGLVGCGTPPQGCAVIPEMKRAELFSQGATRAGMATADGAQVVHIAPPVNGRSFAYKVGTADEEYVSFEARDEIPAVLHPLVERAVACSGPI